MKYLIVAKSRIHSVISNRILMALVLFLAAVVFNSPIINMPYHWDAMDTVGNAHYIYEHGFTFSPGYFSVGHPPLFHTILAVIWHIFGYSIWITHLTVIVISFIGVYFTYLLGSELKSPKIGITAAVLLFFSPLYLSQSGTLNLDLPLSAFIVVALYFALKGDLKWYLVLSASLVMIKESSILFIVSILIYGVFMDSHGLKAGVAKRLFIYGLPAVLYLFCLICYKLATGWFIYPQHIFTYHIEEVTARLYAAAKELFLYDGRLLISSCIFSYFLLKKWRANLNSSLYYIALIGSSVFLIKILFLQEKMVWLFIPFYLVFMRTATIEEKKFFPMTVIMLACLVAFSFYVDYLPRYLTVIYPFYYIIGAYSLVGIFKNRDVAIVIVAITILFLSINNWYGHRRGGGGAVLESNLEYQDVIRTHKSIAKFIEEHYPGGMVLTSWPQIFELRYPFLGYVSRPVKCIYFSDIKGVGDPKIDLVYYSEQSHQADKMQKIMGRLNMRMLKTYECNGKSAALYEIIKNKP